MKKSRRTMGTSNKSSNLRFAVVTALVFAVAGVSYAASTTDLAYASRSLIAAAYGAFDPSPRIIVTRSYSSPKGSVDAGVGQKLAVFNVVSVNSASLDTDPYANYLLDVVATITVSPSTPALSVNELSMRYLFCNDATKGVTQPCMELPIPTTVTRSGNTYTLTSTNGKNLNLYPDVPSALVIQGTPVYASAAGSQTATVTAYIQSATGSSAVNVDLAGGSTLKVTPPAVTIPSISVLTPKGGESWAAGSKQTVKWSYTSTAMPSTNLNLYLVGPNGTTTVGRGIDSRNGARGYVITVPSVATGMYTLRVCDDYLPKGSRVCGQSNAPFTITSSTANPTGVTVTLVSTNTTVDAGDSANDDRGTFMIKYKVTAVGGSVYVSSLANAALSGVTQGKTSVNIDRSGVATAGSGISVTLTNDTDSTITTKGNYRIDAGSSETFTLTATAQLPQVGPSGMYRAALGGMSWGSSDASLLTSTFTTGLDLFKTSYVALN